MLPAAPKTYVALNARCGANCSVTTVAESSSAISSLCAKPFATGDSAFRIAEKDLLMAETHLPRIVTSEPRSPLETFSTAGRISGLQKGSAGLAEPSLLTGQLPDTSRRKTQEGGRGISGRRTAEVGRLVKDQAVPAQNLAHPSIARCWRLSTWTVGLPHPIIEALAYHRSRTCLPIAKAELVDVVYIADNFAT